MQEKKDKEMLFLIAKILRLYQADASRAWVVKNTGNDPELTAKIYDLCGIEETSDAHRILAKLKEGIRNQASSFYKCALARHLFLFLFHSDP